MESPKAADDELGTLLEDIEAASKVPAKRRKTPIKPTIERATNVLYDRGALPDELARLIEVLTVRNQLDQASLGSLLRNLYPIGKVNDEVVLRVVGGVGHGQRKPSLPLQSLLLRWLVMVYHVLENNAILSQAYGVLFNLLDTAAIRPQLCHLLALITRRKHVRPFRIQAILSLSRQTGSDPALIGLLRVFKNYYPEIIVGDATRGRAAAFKHPDLQWRERLDEIRQQHVERLEEGARNGFAVNHALSRQMRGAKLSVIPAVRTLHAQEDSITLEDVDNPDFFAENLEKIELPSQPVAILADPLLQKLLYFRPDPAALSRIRSWLTAYIDDVASGDADPSIFLDLVDILHEFTLSIKMLSPSLITFFGVFIPTWDGREKRDDVLETLSFAPLVEFKGLYSQLFGPLERAILDNTTESQISLLKFYTHLLRRWAVTIRSEEKLGSVAKESIHNLISHVNKLCLTLTQTSPSAATYLTILGFYECYVGIISRRESLQHIEITIPPAILVYILHFSNSLPVLSRISGVIVAYKSAWEVVMAPSSTRRWTRREREQLNTFNGFLMDICNCIWRGRAFVPSDKNAQGCRIPHSLVPILDNYLRMVDSDLALESAFNLSHSPVLCMQAISYVRALEDDTIGIRARHAGPVTEESLAQLARRGGLELPWLEYRAGVLQYMGRNGFGGVPELMYKTMTKLMNRTG